MNGKEYFNSSYRAAEQSWESLSSEEKETWESWASRGVGIIQPVCPRCGSSTQVFTDRSGNYGCWRVGCSLPMQKS